MMITQFPERGIQMEPASFTFLNTTGAPRLSKPAAKRVRGHVTRTNFANRRRKKAEAQCRSQAESTLAHVFTGRRAPPAAAGHDAWDNLAEALSVATSSSDQYHSAQLLNEFWSVIFLSSRGVPGDEDDRQWLRLLASEPALVEATMAMAVRCWSSDFKCDLRAELHAHRATQLLIRCIASQQAYTDGFLGAAFTMALGERLLKNDAAWEIHMGGIVQAVRGRRAQGMSGLPSLFTDLVVLDLVNGVFDFPRVYHPILVQELAHNGCSILSPLDEMARRVAKLRHVIELHRRNRFVPEKVDLEIQGPHDQLLGDADAFLTHDNAYVRNAAKAVQLILSMSWPLETDDVSSAALAGELKEGLAGLPGRSCLYMDVSSCQIILGAVASERGSEAREWFVDKLRRAIRAVQERGWKRPYDILERALAKDGQLLARLRVLWLEEFAVSGPTQSAIQLRV